MCRVHRWRQNMHQTVCQKVINTWSMLLPSPIKGTRQDNADPWALKENACQTYRASDASRKTRFFFFHLLLIIIIPIYSNVLLSYWSLLCLNGSLVFLVHFKLIHLVLSAFLENTAKSNGSAQFLQSAVDLHWRHCVIRFPLETQAVQK